MTTENPNHTPELMNRDADLAVHRSIDRAREAAPRLSQTQAAMMYERIALLANEYAAVHRANARGEPPPIPNPARETRPAQPQVERRAP